MVTSQTDDNWYAVCGEDGRLLRDLTAAVVILGNHLETAIQRLHIRNSQIRASCLGKSQAEVQLNCLNCRELTLVENYALTDHDAPSGEGDAGSPVDAK